VDDKLHTPALACRVGAPRKLSAGHRQKRSRSSGGVITLVFLSADVDGYGDDCLITVFRTICMVLSHVSGVVNDSQSLSSAATSMKLIPIRITPIWPYHSVLSKNQAFLAPLETYNKTYHGNPPIGLECTWIMRSKDSKEKNPVL
jgi:hypothetical protein